MYIKADEYLFDSAVQNACHGEFTPEGIAAIYRYIRRRERPLGEEERLIVPEAVCKDYLEADAATPWKRLVKIHPPLASFDGLKDIESYVQGFSYNTIEATGMIIDLRGIEAELERREGGKPKE